MNISPHPEDARTLPFAHLPIGPCAHGITITKPTSATRGVVVHSPLFIILDHHLSLQTIFIMDHYSSFVIMDHYSSWFLSSFIIIFVHHRDQWFVHCRCQCYYAHLYHLWFFSFMISYLLLSFTIDIMIIATRFMHSHSYRYHDSDREND